MKQILQFLRSAVPSKKPTTSQLELGELSMNTYDGKLFMKRSGSTGESIVSFLPWEDISGSISGGGNASISGSQNYIPVISISGSLVNSLFYQSGSFTSLTGSFVVTENVTANRFIGTASFYDTSIRNIINVGLSGSNVRFNSIKSAVDSITDASENNTYTVRVYPGVYVEDTITMKSWVTVKGDSTTTTIVSGSNPSASIFIGADQSMIIDMQIQGATAPSASAVVYSSPTTPQTNAIFYVENVRFGSNYTHAKVIGTGGGNCIMQCSNVKYGGYPFTLGFHVTNDGSGIGRMQLRNVTSTNGGVTTTSGLVFAKADQPGCTFIVNGALLTKAVGAAAGTGFWVENGGSLRLTAVNFQRWGTAIYAPNTGSAPNIYGTALNFENNTKDVDILHVSASGKIEGTDNFLKVNLLASTPLYEVGKDPRVLKVAKKGGDFTSISSSVAWITDSSQTNRYVIEVGPGQYTEKMIDLTGKPYVSIVGSNIQTTQIFPSASNHDIIKMGINNEISFLTLTNAGSGQAAILVDDIGDFAQAHKISIYDSDIGIKTIANTTDTQFYGEYIDINGTFSYGTYVSSSTSASIQCNLENYYLFPVECAAIGNYVTGPSSSLALYSAKLQGDETPGAVAMKIEDGAEVEASSLDIQNWDTGVELPDVGIAPRVRIIASMIHNSPTNDFNVQNSNASIRFQGVSDHSKIVNTSPNFYWNFLDDTDGELDITRKLSVTFEDGTHTDVTTLILKGSGMGLMAGGTISELGGLTINVANGYGYAEKTDSPDIVARLDWPNSQITLLPNTANYIYFTDAQVLSASDIKPDSTQNIILGRVVTNDVAVEFIDQSSHNANHTTNLLSNFNREALGPVYSDGSIVTENITPKKLDITAGNYYFSENNFTPSGTSSIDLHQYFRSGSGWNRTTSSLVPTDVYNSGSEGTLVPLSASAYTKHTLYGVGDSVDEKYFLVIGQNQYSTLVDAEAAALPTPPTYFSRAVVGIASIYVQSGSANITQIEDIRPVIGFKASGVNASATHGNLLGLDSDDHTQYLLVNGTRQMTGNLGLGGHNLYNVNQVSASVVNATTLTGSLEGTASYSKNSLTASFASYSPTSSYADNLTVSGTITAQKLVVQTISSSVQYSSGSNVFGNNLTNTHQFTGSVLVSGSISVNGSITGSLFGSALSAISSSYTLYSSNALSSSYALSSSQATSAITASYIDTAQTASYVLNAVSASFVSFSSNSISSSYALSSSFTTQAITASFVITAQTASYALNAVSSSYVENSSLLDGKDSTEFAITGSNIFSGSQTISGSILLTGDILSNNPITIQGSSVDVQGDVGGAVSITSNTAPIYLDALSGGDIGISSYNGNLSLYAANHLSLTNVSGGYTTISSGGGNIGIITEVEGDINLLVADTGMINITSNDILLDSRTGTYYITNIPVNNDVTSSLFIDEASGQLFSRPLPYIISGSQQISDFGFAITGSNIFVGDQTITGSLITTGSVRFSEDIRMGIIRIGRGGSNVDENIAMGVDALLANTNGFFNVALGYYSLNRTTTGNQNIAIGGYASEKNITGNYNVSVGTYALQNHTNGYSNVAIGLDSLGSIVSGNNNTALGNGAGLYLITGSHNIFIGYYNGGGMSTGNNNVIIGNSVTLTNNLSNTIVIADGSGNKRIYVNNSGSVGINKTNPNYSAKLDVSGSVLITGSLSVSEGITGSLFGTSSYAENASTAQTASYVLQALSSSYAVTSSYALNGGVTSIIAGTNVSISPSNGVGDVTINATAGGGSSFPYTGSAIVSGSLDVTGSLNAPSITGSLQGTASSAISASNAVSSSYALSSSQSTNAITASYVINAETASFVATAQTASFVVTAQTASYVLQADSSSFSSLAQTASFVTTAQTASYVIIAETASFVVSASNAVSSSYALSSSQANNSLTASFVITAQTASYVLESVSSSYSSLASTASFVTTAQTASYVITAQTASYAITASYAMNAGGSTPATYILSSGAQTISTTATGSNLSAFYNYTLISGSNARAGQFIAVWNGGNIVYTDTSTTDIGNTSLVQFTASLSGDNYLLTTVLPTNGWTLKTILNLI